MKGPFGWWELTPLGLDLNGKTSNLAFRNLSLCACDNENLCVVDDVDWDV